VGIEPIIAGPSESCETHLGSWRKTQDLVNSDRGRTLVDQTPSEHPADYDQIKTSKVAAEKLGDFNGTDLRDRSASDDDFRSPVDEVQSGSDDESEILSDDEPISSSDDESSSRVNSTIKGPPRGPWELCTRCVVAPIIIFLPLYALFLEPLASKLLKPFQ
jgi:hypothetical protein